MKERIYVAGPYTAKDCTLHGATKQVQQNVDRAIAVGNAILLKGHYAFVPHLSHYQHIHHSMTVDLGVLWYDIDNTYIDHWATAFFYIAPSYGADMELTRAESLGLKIYRNLNEITNEFKDY